MTTDQNQTDIQYRETVRELSDRLVEAQRPIRILDAVKWSPEVQEAFFEKGCRELPPVAKSYYEQRPLAFDAVEKRGELQDIDRDISRRLGQFSPVGRMMRRMCGEYLTVVRMLESRGTPEFPRLSQELYGGAGDVFYAGDPSLADLGDLMSDTLGNLEANELGPDDEKNIDGEGAISILQERLGRYFAQAEHPVRVILSDGIVADAAAGSDYIKIRKEARFSERDLRLLEIHEGWVHLGTTLNGQQQPVCTFLSKGPPSSTITQEGLAILMEIIGFASYPARARRLTNRICAIRMAEQGADFLQVFGFFRDQGLEVEECYTNTVRVFRGSTPTGGPFTKDISYSKGFVLIYNFVRLAVRKGLVDRVPLLFCGKLRLEDVRVLSQLIEEGIVVPPVFLPPQIRDLRALTAWMCYSNFLTRLNLDRIEADYAEIL